MSVDWSKKPEGATHFGPETTDYCAAWYRVEGKEVVSYLELASTNSELKPAIHGSAYYHPLEDLESAWNGDGLPPVGTACEFQHRNAPNGVWHPTSIRYSSHAHVIYVDTIDNSEACFTVGDPCKIDFRPIRTAEQIAAEERAKQVEYMVGFIRERRMSVSTPESPKQEAVIAAEALYDAGFRRSVQ